MSQNQQNSFQKGVLERGLKTVRKDERKQYANVDVWWEACTSKMVLPCTRRAYFAKTARRGNGHEQGAKWEPKWLQKWSQHGSLGAPLAKLGRRSFLKLNFDHLVCSTLRTSYSMV